MRSWAPLGSVVEVPSGIWTDAGFVVPGAEIQRPDR